MDKGTGKTRYFENLVVFLITNISLKNIKTEECLYKGQMQKPEKLRKHFIPNL